jgi:hypothetical protein
MAAKKKTTKKKTTRSTPLTSAIDAVAKGHKGAKARLRKAITAHAKKSCRAKSPARKKPAAKRKKKK